MRSNKINRFQGTLRNLQERLRSLPRLMVQEILPKVIMGHEKDIVTMIQWQMWNGKNGAEMGGPYGDIIRPFYRPATIKYKIKKHQPYDRVTLHDKGNFYKAMYVSYNKRYGFFIKSKDKKYSKLVEKYGEEIFRLDRENFNNLIRRIKPEIQAEVKRLMLLGWKKPSTAKFTAVTSRKSYRR